MLHRVLPAAVLVLLLGADHALAGDEPVLPCPPRAQAPAAEGEQGARWPAALKKRNARYASLTRVDDPQGDLHERLIAHMDLARVDDRVGDLEELRRKRADGHIPPRLVAHAHVTRDQDLGGDEDEVILAATTNERRYAETRRFRDLGGDREELYVHRRDLQRRLPLSQRDDVIWHAKVEEDPVRRDYFDTRDHARESLAKPTLSDEERVKERGDERAEDLFFGWEDQLEREHGRTLEDVADDAIEKTLEDGLDALEAADEKSAEQLEERMLERQAEVQAEREESGGATVP